MINNKDIVTILDEYRLQMKLSIQDFTKGILSPRNYTRLLNDEASITGDVLVELLERINLPFEEFILCSNFKKDIENYDEITFVYLVLYENYEKALNKYGHVMLQKDYKTVFGASTIPACIAYLDYYTNKITLEGVKKFIYSLIHLDDLATSKIVRGSDIYTMYLYVKVAEPTERMMVADFLYDVLFDDDYKVLAMHFDNAIFIAYATVLYAYCNEPFSEEMDAKIKFVYKDALKFNVDAVLTPFDIILFEIMYKYLTKNNLKTKYIAFYYVAAILSTSNNDFLRGRTFEIREEDLMKYYKLACDTKFINSKMYKRCIDEY